jgi:DNA-binding XRE family transcriptional regulator
MVMSRPGRPVIRIDFSADIRARYASGELDHYAVAGLYGISAPTALRELRRAGLDTTRTTRRLLRGARKEKPAPRWRPPRTPQPGSRHAAVVKGYKQGLSLNQLGRQFGLTHEGVRQILLNYGVPLRTPGGGTVLRGMDGKSPNLPRLANRLRSLRTRAKLDQHQLAARSGLHPETVRKLETGRHSPAGQTLTKLAKVLGVNLEAFGIKSRLETPRTGRSPRSKA